MKLLLTITLLAGLALAQTATVSRGTTVKPYDGQAAIVRLAWGPPAPTAGWTLVDYCVGGSDVSGQEHGVYKGCGAHVTGTSIDLAPATGLHFWIVWAAKIKAFSRR